MDTAPARSRGGIMLLREQTLYERAEGYVLFLGSAT